MVQIIEENKRPSFRDRVGYGLADVASRFGEQMVKKQMLEQENEKLKQLTGKDFSGINDPDIRKHAFSKLLESKQEEDYLKSVLGEQEVSPRQAKESNLPESEEGGFDISKLSDKKLSALLNSKKYKPQAQAEMKRRADALKTPGGVTAQPIPEEYVERIEDVIASHPDATPDQLGILFDKAGVPPIHSSRYLENRRQAEDQELKRSHGQEALDIKYHERSQPFVDDVKSQYQQAENQDIAIRQMREALSKGETGYGVFRSTFGSLLPTALMESFLSPDEAVFEAAIPNLIEGMKDLFGVRLSDADLRLVRGKLPSLGKSEEANEQILDFLENMGNIKKLKYKIMREEEKKYPKNRPSSFENDVLDRYEPEAAKLKDQYFAAFRLPAKASKKVKTIPLPKNSIRFVSPSGEVFDISKDDKEGVSVYKKYDYLPLMES